MYFAILRGWFGATLGQYGASFCVMESLDCPPKIKTRSGVVRLKRGPGQVLRPVIHTARHEVLVACKDTSNPQLQSQSTERRQPLPKAPVIALFIDLITPFQP